MPQNDTETQGETATGLKAIVCGGRDYRNPAVVAAALKGLGVTHVIHGGATGADQAAGDWARAHGLPVRVFPALWGIHGRAAGPKRNAEMLEHGKPDVVVAFPGGRGTADMVRRALAAGVRVVQVSETTMQYEGEPIVQFYEPAPEDQA